MTPNSSTFQSVYDALLAAAKRDPGKTALVHEGETVSYAELLGYVDNAAAYLSASGIGQGIPFAAYAQNRPELMYCYYAAAKLGAIYVPVNPNLTPSEVEYTFRHSGAKLMLHDDVVAESAKQSVPADALVELAKLTGVNDLPVPAAADVSPEDDFLIIYTSGTTGVPKAIVLDHAAQIAGAASLAQMWGLTAEDVTLVALPLGYLYGLSTAAAVGLQSGGTVVILRRFHPRYVLAGMVEHQVTIFHGVPTMFSMMLEYSEQNDFSNDLSFVRALICAGSPMPQEMRQRFATRFGAAIQDYYAMTEATPVFGRYFDDPDPIPEGAVGRAAPGVTVRIVRSDGSDCEIDEEGEVLVRASATMKRYMNAPSQTEASFKDGLFRSGDLGRRDARGYFYITGRIKDIIIRGGANISPAEVEAVIATHPGVQDVAVIGIPDRIFGEVPAAVVVRRFGSNVTEEELIAHASAPLADFKVPKRYIFISQMPLGKTGKIDKTALKQRYATSAN
jgi:long-chain acyl-CoA synthetase